MKTSANNQQQFTCASVIKGIRMRNYYFFFTFQDLFDATSRCKDTFGIFKCVGCPQAIYREKTCKFEISYSSVRNALQNVLRLQRLRRPEIELA